MNIYLYESLFGCMTYQSHADDNPLETDEPLLPAYSTPSKPPITGDFECARYLDKQGNVPAHHADGCWFIHPDWREIPLWNKESGKAVFIMEPNVIPDSINATSIQYPGAGYIWSGGEWKYDHELFLAAAEAEAEAELTSRQSYATAEISRIKPAVDGGYAKQEDIELLPKWQRYLYELPDVRTKPGWPDKPQWTSPPATVI